MDSVTAPVASITPVAGGSLVAGTTYYYTIIAVSSISTSYQYIGTNKNVMWSPPSNEVSFTADATNKTAQLTWTKPTELSAYDDAQWGVFIFRSTVSGAYTSKIRTQSAPRDTLVSTLTYNDDGSKATDVYHYPIYGLPRLVCPDGTSGAPLYIQDIYDWMVANGWTNFIVRELDSKGNAQSWVLKFTIYLKGYLMAGDDATIIHNGTIWIAANATLEIGRLSSVSDFNAVSYKYNWESAYWNIDGTLIVNGSAMMFAAYGIPPAYYYGSAGKLLANYSLITDNFPGEMKSETKGYCKNSIIHNCKGMFPSSKFFVDNLIIKSSVYAFYGYYGGAFMGMRNLSFDTIANYGVFFHKNSTVGVMHAVNITLPANQATPTANYNSNRQNFSVLRKYETLFKIIDEDNNPLSGVTVSIKDNTGTEVYRMTSDANGLTALARGTATSGSTTTLVDTSANWEVDSLKNHIVDIVGGTGIGQGAWISGNTANTITFYGDQEVAIASGSQYVVNPQVIKEKYYCANSTATMSIDNYGDHTITISKPGYETYEKVMTITKKIDEVIKLKTAIDIRDGLEGENYLALNPELGSSSDIIEV